MALILEDKVALVTGASRGVGRAIALSFAKQGARVAVNYNKSKKEAEEVEKAIQEMGREVYLIQADVSNREQAHVMIESVIAKYGRIDILVNNAGIYPKDRRDFFECDKKRFEEVMNTNLGGVVFCSQAAITQMLKQGQGVIINIASDAGLTPKKSRGTIYATSKAGIIYLTRCLAETFPNIRINAIAPGYTETDMTPYLRDPEIRRKIEAKIPSGRVNQPEDIANAVLSLVSEDSTGEILVVKGGESRKVKV